VHVLYGPPILDVFSSCVGCNFVDFKFAQVIGTFGAEWLVATPGLYCMILLQNKQCPSVCRCNDMLSVFK